MDEIVNEIILTDVLNSFFAGSFWSSQQPFTTNQGE